MASIVPVTTILILACFLSISFINQTNATTRNLAELVQEEPLVLKYHNGLLLKGDVPVNLVWYGHFTPAQRAVIVDFISSLSAASTAPSVASWWQVTARYKGGQTKLHLGKQSFDEAGSLGKSLKSADLAKLAASVATPGSITAVLTSKDVAVEGFCMSRCGTHASAATPVSTAGGKGGRFAYLWVGNSETQCPGQCAWPFHQPTYGPQTPPLVAPNADVGVDGMIINLATVLAGAVTNPYNNGYFQGPATAPLEAVSACTGMFGSGSYPGYPGKVLVDAATGGSYNAKGLNGRKYLLPAIWDPNSSTCSTLV